MTQKPTDPGRSGPAAPPDEQAPARGPENVPEGLTDPARTFPGEDQETGSEGSGRNVGLGRYSEVEGHKVRREGGPPRSELTPE